VAETIPPFRLIDWVLFERVAGTLTGVR